MTTMEKWTGDIVAKCHTHKITQTMLAKELGCTRTHLNLVLNGKRRSPAIENRANDAIKSIIAKRKADVRDDH